MKVKDQERFYAKTLFVKQVCKYLCVGLFGVTFLRPSSFFRVSSFLRGFFIVQVFILVVVLIFKLALSII